MTRRGLMGLVLAIGSGVMRRAGRVHLHGGRQGWGLLAAGRGDVVPAWGQADVTTGRARRVWLV